VSRSWGSCGGPGMRWPGLTGSAGRTCWTWRRSAARRGGARRSCTWRRRLMTVPGALGLPPRTYPVDDYILDYELSIPDAHQEVITLTKAHGIISLAVE
jgi:hypothetical protein